MLLKLTLTPVREDRERYSSIVSYEEADPGSIPVRHQNLIGSNAAATGVISAVRRVRQWVQDPRGAWRFVVTRFSRIRVPGRLHREWPRHIDEPAPEPEALRRARIRAMRAAIHVDPALGAMEPDWDAAAKLGLEASARSMNHKAFANDAQVSEYVAPEIAT